MNGIAQNGNLKKINRFLLSKNEYQSRVLPQVHYGQSIWEGIIKMLCTTAICMFSNTTRYLRLQIRSILRHYLFNCSLSHSSISLSFISLPWSQISHYRLFWWIWFRDFVSSSVFVVNWKRICSKMQSIGYCSYLRERVLNLIPCLPLLISISLICGSLLWGICLQNTHFL